MAKKDKEQTSLVASEGPGKITENARIIEFDCTNEGHIKQSRANMVLALSEDDDFRNLIGFNQFTNRIVLQSDPWWNRDGRTRAFDDIDECHLRLELEQRYGLSAEKKIYDAIQIVANNNGFHPIRDILESLKWDGKDRIADFFPKYLGAERCEYTTEITKNFLMGGVNRLYHPGCKYDTMLVLIDIDGGGGKSTLARFLALNDEFFTDDVKDFDDAKIAEKIIGHWIIEICEMQGVANAKSIESLKAFLSRQKDNYRTPYARYAKDIPRQCVFIGTSNDTQFLPQDSSGYRRFMPLRVDKTRAEKHPLEDERETREYIDQLWAQAMTIFKSGDYSLVLPDEIRVQLENVVTEYAPEDLNFQIIQNWLESKPNIDQVCVPMLYEKALGKVGYKSAQQWERREIARIMDRMPGWKLHDTKSHQARFDEYGPYRAWDRIPEGFRDQNDTDDIPFE